MKKIEKDAQSYICNDGFKETMPFLSNTSTKLNISDDGKILNDPNELMALDYIDDGDITLNYELLTKMSKDLGPFHEKVKKIRKELDLEIAEYRRANNNSIDPKIFFKDIRSNLIKISDKNFLRKLNNTKKLIEYYKSSDQVGAEDKAKTIMLGLNKEHVIFKNNINFFINRKNIVRFMPYVKFRSESIVLLKQLKDFPRIIPNDVLSIINELKENKIFDDYEILYLDYTGDKHETETFDSHLERDPVLFGTIKEFPDKLYFISYWDDHLCDLTMEDILEEMIQNPNREEFGFLKDVQNVDLKYIKKIEKELNQKNSLTQKTNDSKNKFIKEIFKSRKFKIFNFKDIIKKIKFKS